jgi:hypothetical protein
LCFFDRSSVTATGTQARLKYYFSWSLTLTALQLSGAAFEGAGTGGWRRGENVRPLRVELATSAVAFPANWNICTGAHPTPEPYEGRERAAAAGGARDVRGGVPGQLEHLHGCAPYP